MMINRDNYEEYFLLYTDNELSRAEKIAIEEFIKENPDLRGELVMLQQLKLKPEQDIFFSDKSMLLRESRGSSTIDHDNYEEYFLLYADDELNADEKKMVEEFVSNNLALRQEFELLLITQVGPDKNVVFPNKEILYRKPERRIVLLPWMRIAAAVVLLLVGLFVFNNTEKKPVQPIAKTNDTHKSDTNNIAENKNQIKKNDPVVTSSSTDSLNITNAASKKLAANNQVKKMSERKNKNINTKQNQQQLRQDVLLPSDDSAEQIFAAVKINKSVQKVNEGKKTEITAPAFTSKTANVVAFVRTNDSDADMNPDSDDKGNIYVASTSTTKNRFRGFFRKVSRAFNKTAHVDNENNDAILIGSFRIALK